MQANSDYGRKSLFSIFRGEGRLLAYLATALTFFALSGALVYNAALQLGRVSSELQQTHQALRQLDRVTGALATAQNSQRDFVITGDPNYLEAIQDNLLELDAGLREARKLAPLPLGEKLSALDPLITRQVEFISRGLQARRKQGPAAAASLLKAQGSGRTLERLLREVAALSASEALRAKDSDLRLQGRFSKLRLLILLGGALALAMLASMLLVVHRETRRRESVETALRDSVKHLERVNQELGWLEELASVVQACHNPEELARASEQLMKKIFAGPGGSLLLAAEGSRRLEPALRFGPAPLISRAMDADECWGLRKGQAHSSDAEQGTRCSHFVGGEPGASLCLPLLGHGGIYGLFTLAAPPGQHLDERRAKLAELASEQLSLALANLRLREFFRQQSRRDPLTGLFNRRAMEERFERDDALCRQGGHPFSLAMVDVDYFKKFNDRFGHDAGDEVLKSIAASLQASVRPSDAVCRFGGEELVLLLPETDADSALGCAEHCRRSIEALRLSHHGQDLGPLTVSIGVATQGEKLQSLEALIKAADEALYRAKQEGRNRVRAAELAG